MIEYKTKEKGVLFDWVIGWGEVYPPSDEALDGAYGDAPLAVRNAYNFGGIDLAPIYPGEKLHNRALTESDDWYLELDPDWSVDFARSMRRTGSDPTDEKLWAEAVKFANAVELACNRDLAAYLNAHRDELPRWEADEFGFTVYYEEEKDDVNEEG